MGILSSFETGHMIGMEVGSSTIVEELCRGGMAVIFVAYQRTLKRRIAMKVLPKALLTEYTAELFQREAESSAVLYHPNIIPVYEVGETDDFLYFSMQLVEGESLSEHMKRRRKNIIPSKRVLPMKEAVSIGVQILDALDYAHSEGVVHRDIKPGNILLEERSSRPILLDFGVAKVLKEDAATHRLIQGTPVYMAPEQILGRGVDGRADIYALGITLAQMILPQLPFPPVKSALDLMKAKVKRKEGIFTKPLSAVNPNIGDDLNRVLFRATACHPDDRYRTCRKMKEELEGCLQ